MKHYVMNKNVHHDNKDYKKGQEITKADVGFDVIVEAGHADELSLKGHAAQAEASSEVESESAKQSAEQEKSSGKQRR